LSQTCHIIAKCLREDYLVWYYNIWNYTGG